jgi:hypothetical protein
MLLHIQLCAFPVSPAPQPTFISWRRRWQPILPIRDLCWRSIAAAPAANNLSIALFRAAKGGLSDWPHTTGRET